MQTHTATPLDAFHDRPNERPATDGSQVEKSEYMPAIIIEYFSPFIPRAASPAALSHTTIMYSEDGGTALDLCEGPSESGECQRALTANGCVQCAGLWLGGSGWMFKAAEDARACPMAMIGLA